MTTALHAAAAVFAALAVLLTAACAVGVAAMRDPLQRLHYIAPPSTLGAILLAAAIGLEAGWAALVKPVLVVALLTALNGVVTHATARAAFVRRHGRWPPDPSQSADAAEGRRR